MSERKVVLESVRRTEEGRGLAHRVQLRTAAFGAWVLNASGVRGPGRFAFWSVESHTSGSASRLPWRLRRRGRAGSGLDPDPAA